MKRTTNLQSTEFRLVALDGTPHPVLDAPYESLDSALSAARTWCEGQGRTCALGSMGIGIERMTPSGRWRTVAYPMICLREIAV